MSEVESYLEHFEYDETSLSDEIGDLIEEVDLQSSERLLKEAEKCIDSGLLKSAMINLWCATSEQLKDFLWMYDREDLSNVSYIGNISSLSDLDNESDSNLIKAANELNLIGSTELPIIQAVYKVRCAFAHGDNEEISEKELCFCLMSLRDSIFSKRSIAGINTEFLFKLIESGQAPEKYFEAAENFELGEQHKLARKLYERKKELPVVRMEVRDRYLFSKAYTREEAEKRDSVVKALDNIWDKIEEGVRETRTEKAFREFRDKEQIQQFIISYCMQYLSEEERNEVLSFYLNNRHPGDYEEQNDVAITLARSEDLSGISEETVKSIWQFCKQEYGYQNEPEKTRELYREILRKLDSDGRKTISEDIVEQIDSKGDYNLDEKDFNELKDHTKNLIDFKYIREYFEVFEEENSDRILEALEDSEFTKIGEIEEFIQDSRNS